MFGSNILEVVIGLVFIFLLYSLLATTIKEGLATVFNMRAAMLEKAIKRMLDDGIYEPHSIWEWIIQKGNHLRNFLVRLVAYIVPPVKKWEKNIDKYLVKKFYDHPAIKYLGENKLHKKPNYISPDYFSKAVVDMLKEMGGAPVPDANQSAKDQVIAGIQSISTLDETRKLLQSYIEDSPDLDKFREHIEKWFNETMDRTSGWYKRQAQRIIFVTGLVIAIVFNVDTISIVKKLSKDKDARKALTELASASYKATYEKQQADSAKKQAPAHVDSVFAHVKSLIERDITDANTLIGLGWYIPATSDTVVLESNAAQYGHDVTICKSCVKKVSCEKAAPLTYFQKAKYVLCVATSSGRKFLGYLITALAISFGAPFWFDTLSKLMQLRGGGKKPEEKEEQIVINKN